MSRHLDLAELESRWQERSATAGSGLIALLVVRTGGGEHQTPARVELDPARGVVGDRWARGETPDPESQITLIAQGVAELLVDGDATRLHVPGDNIVVDLDLGESALPEGTRLRVGSALLEITGKLHAGCAKFRARLGDDALRWVNTPTGRLRRLRGVHARVIEAGTASVGDRITRVG
jgi:MOSC domain-containing protein YiiM